MHTTQDIKEELTSSKWDRRVKANRRRIYALLLCADEHEAFRSYIEKAWWTLDAISGESCDVFTLEQHNMPAEKRIGTPDYVYIEGGKLGRARIEHHGRRIGFTGGRVAIDNGIKLPDRRQCIEVKTMLFGKRRGITLPGLAIFPSPFTNDAEYYKCNGLDSSQLSENFQLIFESVREAYDKSSENPGSDRFDVFENFRKLEKTRAIKERLVKALMEISLKEAFDLLSGGVGLVIPKRGGRD
jgi:hypothetical protein